MNNVSEKEVTQSLIPVITGEIAGVTAQLVDARILHHFLESKQHFSIWFKKRVSDYEFIQGIDFEAQQKNGSLKSTACNEKSQVIDSSAQQKNCTPKSNTYGNDKIDYFITIDMAKELGMIERSDKGREIRRYFIEMERIAKSSQYGLKQLPTLPAPRAKTMLKGGLELEQQDAINDQIKARMETVPQAARGGMTIRLYSAINTKFGTKGMTGGYKNIAPEHFDNIIQFIARVPLEENAFVTLTVDEFKAAIAEQAKALPAPPAKSGELMDGEQLSALITREIGKGIADYEAKQAGVAKPSNLSVTIGLDPLRQGELMRRWLVTQYAENSVQSLELTPDTKVMTRAEFIGEMQDDGLICFDRTGKSAHEIINCLPVKFMPDVIESAVQRIKTTFEN